ncbi:hypothetical protein, partial [Leclercia adecarboxylata]|uniref:hypothetical protein n=1 Tax=Leclercia adecarboxylata TaxID=83655 RepID=UPI001C92FF4C
AFAHRCEVAYITLSSFRVKRLFHAFSLLTRRLVCRCSVSVEAHYRQFFGGDKHKSQKVFRSLTFRSLRLLNPRIAG